MIDIGLNSTLRTEQYVHSTSGCRIYSASHWRKGHSGGQESINMFAGYASLQAIREHATEK